jgi:hypothetical protein
MAYTFQCADCGYAADVPKGGGWPTCPACGGNKVHTREKKRRPAAPPAPAEPPETAEEGQ